MTTGGYKQNMLNNQATNDYIVDLNKSLLSENQNLIARMVHLEEEVKKKNEELDDINEELGREEKSNNYLKSLLKNFLETSKMFEQISDNRKLISDINYRSIKNFKNDISKNYHILAGIYFSLFAISILTMEYSVSLLILFYTSLPVGVLEYYIYIFNLPMHTKENEKINQLLNKIKEVETSQDYIHEFIDNI